MPLNAITLMGAAVSIANSALFQRQDIENLFTKIWLARDDRYSELRHTYKPNESEKKIEMYRMGG